MRSYLMILSFILLFAPGNAPAQNLTHWVDKNESEPAAERRLADSQIEPVDINSTLVKIEVQGLREHFFKAPKAPKGFIGDFIERANKVTENAFFQRQRFEETGQPIEIDQDNIYYRRDQFSYTKGIIFCELFNGRVDFGLYKKHFSPATTFIGGGLTPDYGQQDAKALLFRNGQRIFFSLRVKLPMK